MSENTKIEWADHTFNPWIGCTKVSPACDNCYAARQDAFRHWTPEGWGGPRKRTKTWNDPVRWNKRHDQFFAEHGRRQRVFCASLADVFDNQVPDEWRSDLFELIRSTPSLDWLLLTKRPQNITRMVREHGAIAGNGTRYLPDNVALGTTAEDEERANLNLPWLLSTREELGARVLFVSIEPMLGAIDLTRVIHPKFKQRDAIDPYVAYDTLRGHMVGPDDVGLAKLDWVIAGGESGPHARPAHPDWFRSLREQCAAAGVPFHFKQWGEHSPGELAPHPSYPGDDSAWRVDQMGLRWHDPMESIRPRSEWEPIKFSRPGKKLAGRLLDGVKHNGFPA